MTLILFSLFVACLVIVSVGFKLAIDDFNEKLKVRELELFRIRERLIDLENEVSEARLQLLEVDRTDFCRRIHQRSVANMLMLEQIRDRLTESLEAYYELEDK